MYQKMVNPGCTPQLQSWKSWVLTLR